MKKLQYVIAALMLAGATSANATVIANDSFDITNVTTTNPRSVKNDNGGDGWAGSWQTQMSASTAPQLVAANMEGGTALQFTNDSAQAAFRMLEDPISGDVLVDFLIQVSGTPKVNTFVGFWFGNSDGPSFGLKTDCGGAVTGCTNDFFARTIGQAGPFIPNSAVVANQTYHLFAHLYKSKGSSYYDNLDAWMNPTAAEMYQQINPDVHASGISKIESFDTIGFRTVNFATGVKVRVDALTIASVPEPGSLALMGLSALGMGFLRRRKQG